MLVVKFPSFSDQTDIIPFLLSPTLGDIREIKRVSLSSRNRWGCSSYSAVKD